MARTPSVPYCTVKGFRAALDILRIEKPAVLDRQWLLERGLSPHSVYPVLGAMRFLGLIDEAGGVLPAADAFLGQDPSARHALLAHAYRDVLATVTFPVEDREVVDGILIEHHDIAPGVAAFCSTFFLWLAAESGFPVATLGRNRRGRPPAHLAQLSEPARLALLANETLSRPTESDKLALDRVFSTPSDAQPASPRTETVPLRSQPAL